MVGFLLSGRKLYCLNWPHRWQASSHRFWVVQFFRVHLRTLWELACQRRRPPNHQKTRLNLAFDNRPKPALPN